MYDSPTRNAIVSFGRKNAKKTLAAMLCLLHLCAPEAKPNTQLISAAQSRDQATLLFALMAKMVFMSPDMSDVLIVRESKKQVLCPDLGTFYAAISADVKTNFGADFDFHA